MKPPSPTATALLGLAGAVIPLVFVVVAHVVGLSLDKSTENILILAGLGSAGASMYGWKQMPVPPKDGGQ